MDAAKSSRSEHPEAIYASAPGLYPVGSEPIDQLLVDAVAAVWAVTVQTVPIIPIPDIAQLEGLSLYFQVAMINPGEFPEDPIKMSNGLKVTLGGKALRYGLGSGIDLWAPMAPDLGSLFQPEFRLVR